MPSPPQKQQLCPCPRGAGIFLQAGTEQGGKLGGPLLPVGSPAPRCHPYLLGDLPEARWGSVVAGGGPNSRTHPGQNSHPGLSSCLSRTNKRGGSGAKSPLPVISATIHDPHCWASICLPTPKSPAWKVFTGGEADLRGCGPGSLRDVMEKGHPGERRAEASKVAHRARGLPQPQGMVENLSPGFSRMHQQAGRQGGA